MNVIKQNITAYQKRIAAIPLVILLVQSVKLAMKSMKDIAKVYFEFISAK